VESRGGEQRYFDAPQIQIQFPESIIINRDRSFPKRTYDKEASSSQKQSQPLFYLVSLSVKPLQIRSVQ
jgi:hypothetical protein